MLSGDLGTSIFSNLPVAKLIGQRLEPTLALAIATIIFAILVAVPMGVIAAWKAGTLTDRVIMVFAVLGFSVPVFVIGYAMMWLFSITLGWFPVQGYKPIGDGFWPFLRSITLPTVALGIIYVALIARITRASMLEVLTEDYIRTAQAPRASTTMRLLIRHALRNAAVPIVTVIGIGFALLIGGVVVTESVFNIPGPRAAYGRCGAAAGLPGHPGRDPDLLGRLRVREPRDRPVLHRSRSEDPLLMADAPQAAAFPGEIEDEGPRPGAWARIREYWRRHPTVVVGGMGSCFSWPWPRWRRHGSRPTRYGATPLTA